MVCAGYPSGGGVGKFLLLAGAEVGAGLDGALGLVLDLIRGLHYLGAAVLDSADVATLFTHVLHSFLWDYISAAASGG